MLDDVDALSPIESDDAGEANTQAAEIAEHIRRLWTEQVSLIFLGLNHPSACHILSCSSTAIGLLAPLMSPPVLLCGRRRSRRGWRGRGPTG